MKLRKVCNLHEIERIVITREDHLKIEENS